MTIASVCSVCSGYMCVHVVMHVWCVLVNGNEEGNSDQTKQRTFGVSGPFIGQKCHKGKQRRLEEAGHVLDGPVAPSCGQPM